MNKYIQTLTNGIIKENPTFVLLLGLCPTLATTTSGINGMSMGLATTFVLIFANLVISLLKKLIPDAVRIPAFIVVIAGFVTVLQLLIKAFLPSLDASLGLFIPLIVVNCIVLGRAESVASKQNPIISILDGISIGLGFTLALTVLGAIRELLGSGKVFDMVLFPDSYGALTFILPPGAFLVLGCLIALFNVVTKKS
ncbi:electron transporter RsxE [Porphyromonas gingivicanis]|uniref:Ion-translocating oxidoreductase complex subunit E n=1 Tax=Porphyromonas gingivicanis TaxID=266762 RepID=A0A0A2G4T5_9PORP|nr:electron transport complex subunit E [Porphyromonas gingivicanis]KGN97462.1 electron transporter RsxE [Porphyromonas gingivicanis]